MSPASATIRLRYLARHVGWPAIAGLMLLGAAGLMEFRALPEAQQKLDTLRTAIARARAQRIVPERGTADAASLIAALPGRDGLESRIADIHRTASAQGLLTTGSEYRSRRESNGEMLRHEISLPFQGAYAPLRAWLAELTALQPALAIEELNLRRAAAETGRLDGHARLVLFLRARSPSATGRAAVASAPTLPTMRFAPAAGDLFAVRSWQPPPPSQPAVKPSAPPLPFKYTGKLIENKTVRVFLTQGDTTTLVAAGDKLGNYDIERISTSSVALLYRPLQEKQILNFGGYD